MFELDLVSFTQAKDLKDLGFPQETDSWSYYDIDGKCTPHLQKGGHKEYCCDAPSLDLVVKWLREEKNIWVNVWADSEDNEDNKFNTVFYEQVCYGKDNKILSNKGTFVHLTYEEALSAGIDKALEILKKKYYEVCI